MNFRMLELEQTTLYGVSKPFDGQGYKTREELRHIMWADDCDDVPGRICEGHWNQPSNHAYDGIWYGIWKNGNYMIARPETSGKKIRSKSKLFRLGLMQPFKQNPEGLPGRSSQSLRN